MTLLGWMLSGLGAATLLVAAVGIEVALEEGGHVVDGHRLRRISRTGGDATAASSYSKSLAV